MGSAFSFPCIDNGHNVSLIGSPLENNIIDKLNRKNKFHKALGLSLSKKLKIFKVDKLTEKLKLKNDLIVVAVNSKGIEWAGKEISKYFVSSSSILLLTKGLTVINNEFTTLVEKFKLILEKNNITDSKISGVGGPCLASGLANRIKSSVVLANENKNIVKNIGNIISTDYYSTEFSNDLLGVEICAAIKNIYSMIIGASEGLNSSNIAKDIKKKYYLNTAASLMHKAINEMVYFTKTLKGKEETVYGLSGLGDLYVSSAGGRNSKMGKYLGEGYDYKTAKEKFMKNETIEGAELILEIGTKVLRDFDTKKIPLMTSLIKSILENRKLEINW